MPKLRPLPPAVVCRILAANGFVRVRQSGSHIIMRRELPGGDSATVPVPNHREVTQIGHPAERSRFDAFQEVSRLRTWPACAAKRV
ncbi:MAG: type II toxin-antitoxin system HicA family toxin, partial [Opitutaceae bacterium]